MNRIGKLSLQLDCGLAYSRTLLQRSSRLFHQHLQAELDALLQEAAQTSRRSRRWRTLTLDLGELPLAGFEEAFLQRLRPLLANLLRQGDEARPDSDTDDAIIPTEPTGAEVEPFATLLLRYLDSGLMSPPLLRQLVKLNGSDWLPAPGAQPRWQSQLAALCLRPHGLERLTHVLSTPQMARLCQLFWPTVHAWPALDKSTYGVALALAATGLQPPLSAEDLTAITSSAVATPRAMLESFLPPARDLPASPALSHAQLPATATAVPVSNAGLVLLWPFLARILRQWEHLQDDQFLSQAAQCHAVCWIDSWLWQDEEGLDWRCGVTKWLCGLPPDQPLPQWFAPDPDQWPPLQACLDSLPSMIPSLHRCTPHDVRSWFLQRPGELTWSAEGGYWQLTVERDACDILLDAPPWPLATISLPWQPAPLRVDWLP